MITLDELNCESENIDLDKYMNFVEFIKEDMQFPEWLGDITKEELEELLLNNSKIWLYSLKETLICSMMITPLDNEDLREYELDYKENEIVNYDAMFVSPHYTGNHLQLQMLKQLDKYSINRGYNYALCITHPDNIYSIDNIEKDGFVLKKTKRSDKGIKNLYIKNLKEVI